MRALQTTLFVVTALILSTQAVRHIYVRCLEPTGSVLDRYEPAVTTDIKKATSLDELVELYDEAHNKVKAADADEESKDPANVSGSKSEVEPYKSLLKSEKEPYKSESLLKEAIKDWESKTREVFELRYFWFSGVAFLIIGFLCYWKKLPWLGLTLLIAGFSEMIWATSPSFRGTPQSEFDRLLTNKIVLSLISLVLLLGIGFAVRRIESKRERSDGTAEN
ncbi:MAG TPA: hypothetical protein VN937_04185 [Blastocatellia bacterium]|nr:hypothetical protein [Blastocatellia bacterium]